MADIFGMAGSSGGGGGGGGAAAGAAAGSVLGPVGAIGGAIIGAAGSYFSGKSAEKYAMYAQKHRYRWMVNDLQKAGLNPMLAVGQSPGSPPQPDYPDIGEGALKGAQAVQSARLMASQIDSQKEQANLARAQANKSMVEGQRQEMDNLVFATSPAYQSALQQRGDFGEIKGVSAVQQERWTAELENIKATGAKLLQDTENQRLANELQRGEISLQQVRIKYADQLANIESAYRAAMAKAASLQIPAAQADAEFWSEAGPLGKAAVFFKGLFGK